MKQIFAGFFKWSFGVWAFYVPLTVPKYIEEAPAGEGNLESEKYDFPAALTDPDVNDQVFTNANRKQRAKHKPNPHSIHPDHAKAKRQHMQHAISQVLNSGLPDFAEKASEYSLKQRTGDLKKLLEPGLFDRSVKQLLLLEKFKDNPLALKRFLELQMQKQKPDFANNYSATSFAERDAHGANFPEIPHGGPQPVLTFLSFES